MSFDDSVAPYGNHYNIAKRFDKVLFRPGRPAFSQELLEMQSIQDNQLKSLGDSIFLDGAIISGMDIIPKPDKKISGKYTPNTFSVATMFADNAKYDTSNYVDKGELDIISEANLSSDIVGVEMQGVSTIGQNITASFTVQQVSGHLFRLNLQYNEKELRFLSWKIDGWPVISSISDIATKKQLTVDNGVAGGKEIDLTDGAEHQVEAHFRAHQSGNYMLKLVLNGGYDLTTDNVSIKLLYPYFEDGDKVTTPWHINSKDSGTPSAQERVKNYTVTEGRVYLNGAVRLFDQQDFSIKGVGKEEIGLRLNEDVITAQDDPSLLDDTPNAVTRGEAGADRLHYSVVLTYNDASATPFVVFQDNVINPRAVKPDYSNLEPILARRTYDQSGSFRSYGFEGHMKMNPDPEKGAQDPTDASQILMTIDAGQAYVKGYSVSTSQPTTLKFKIANDTTTSVNEGYQYDSSSSKPIELLNQPVKSVSGVTYTSQITDTQCSIPVGKGPNVTFTKDNVTYIHSIYDNSGTHNASNPYTEGVDYTYTGNIIHWGLDQRGNRLPGNPQSPQQGQSFTVVYDCSHNGIRDVDYKVVPLPGGKTGIDFYNMRSSYKPTNQFLVSYSYFTARIDMIRITMDQANPFKVIPGTPAPLNTVTPPIVKDPYSLELGYVLIMPNSHKATFTMQTVTRITFNTLQQWGRRLTNTEQNVALNNMREEIKRSEDPRLLKDAFADSFNTIYNRDDQHTTVAYDFENGTIFLPTEAAADLKPDGIMGSSIYALKGSKGTLVTAPYHDEAVVDQPIWTDVTNINEFNVFTANGTLTLTPDSDNWTDYKHAQSFNVVQEPKTLELHKWWRHLNDHSRGWYGDGKDPAAHAIEQRAQESQWNSQLAGIYDPGAGNTLGETGWMIAQGGTQTTNAAQEYMRPNKVKFVAKNFKPFKGGFHITIDGTPVQAPTPDSSTYNGDPHDVQQQHNNDGTCTYFQADANGEIHGSFMIPGGTVRCGTRTVTIFNADNDQAVATYTANGTTITNTDIIEKRIYTVNLWDPLAQSFYLNETRQLSNIILYFKSKPTSNDTHRPQLIVQIREVGNEGMPTRTVRAEEYLDPSQINVSDDGTAATAIQFSDAVTLSANQGYAIVLISDSNEYSVFTASKGHTVKNKDKATSITVYNSNPDAITNSDPKAMGRNETIVSNISVNPGDTLTRTPNTNGDLFISNNGMTWQPDGGSSLMFTVNACVYSKNAEVVFSPIIFQQVIDHQAGKVWAIDSNSDKGGTPDKMLKFVDRIATLTNFLTYQNTSVHWFYRYLSRNDVSGNGNVSSQSLENLPWNPLTVNNSNQTIDAPGASEEYTPTITTSDTPQQVDGALNLFRESAGIQLKAVFDVDRYISPVLKKDTISLASFLTGKEAVYQSIDLDESDDAAYNKIKVEYDAYLPSQSCHVNPMYSFDGGNTWYNFPGPGDKKGSVKLDDENSKDSSTPTKKKVISRFFTRYTYEATIPDVTQGTGKDKVTGMDENHMATEFRLRLVLSSDTNFRTPRVRQLTAVMKADLPDDTDNGQPVAKPAGQPTAKPATPTK